MWDEEGSCDPEVICSTGLCMFSTLDGSRVSSPTTS